MNFGRSGRSGAAGASGGGGAAARTSSGAARGGTGTGQGAPADTTTTRGTTSRPYVTVAGTPSGNFSVPIGALVWGVSGSGWVPRFSHTLNGDNLPWVAGVVVETPMQVHLQTPVAISGVVRVAVEGSVETGACVRGSRTTLGVAESAHKDYFSWLDRPPGAVGYSLGPDDGGYVVIFLLGSAGGRIADDAHRAWRVRVDFDGSPALTDTAGARGNLVSGGVQLAYLSGGGTPASQDYLGRGSQVRIVPDSGPTAPDIFVNRPGAPTTLGELFNPGGATFAEIWELETRWAQVGSSAQTRRIGLAASSLAAAGEPANGLYFRHTNGGNIIAVARRATVETTLDTGVAASVGSYHTARMWTYNNGGEIHVAVDETYIGSLGHADLIGPNAMVGLLAGGSNTTAGQGLDIDFLACHGRRPV